MSEPRIQVWSFAGDHGGKPSLLSKADFDAQLEAGQFAVGPYRETFGDGYGEPYNPHRQAFGKLNDGRVVYCELNP